jgi:hypothetical protein
MIRGGLRTRLVLDSFRLAVLSALEQRGWFDPTIWDTPPGQRRHKPFRYISRPVDWVDTIEPNAIAISSEDIGDEPRGFGGEVEDGSEIYIDIFAQDDSLGWEVVFDIRDSLLGKVNGSVGPQIDVYDFRQATPAPFTTVDIGLVEVDRSQGHTRTWQRYWYMIHVNVLDEYDDEFAEPSVSTASSLWTTTDRALLDRIQQAESAVP